MRIIDEEMLDKASELQPTVLQEEVKIEELDEEKLTQMLADLENPISYQKEMAAKIKVFIDYKMKLELEENDNLSESTRRWIESYNNLLDKLQKAIHGEKSVSLNLHHISHSDIASKIRDSI